MGKNRFKQEIDNENTTEEIMPAPEVEAVETTPIVEEVKKEEPVKVEEVKKEEPVKVEVVANTPKKAEVKTKGTATL